MRRGIYSHSMGYLGGVSYAILVARICQDFPELETADLLLKFFEFYSEWKWIEPIYIKVGKVRDHLNINSLQLLDSYSYEVMPIMTPNTNPKNSAYRICEHTYQTIREEFIRAREIIKKLTP